MNLEQCQSYVFRGEFYIYLAIRSVRTYPHILLPISTSNGLQKLLPRVFPSYELECHKEKGYLVELNHQVSEKLVKQIGILHDLCYQESFQ